MLVKKKIAVDLAEPGITPRISAVQNDANTRALEIILTANGEAWQVPAGITAAVAYRKPDGTRGLYDTLPDGSSAVSVSGNVVTAILAPQALTVAGEISAAVLLNDKDLNQLATFPFVIEAATNPAAGAASDDYYAYSTMEKISDAVEAVLTEVVDARTSDLGQIHTNLGESIRTNFHLFRHAYTPDFVGEMGLYGRFEYKWRNGNVNPAKDCLTIHPPVKFPNIIFIKPISGYEICADLYADESATVRKATRDWTTGSILLDPTYYHVICVRRADGGKISLDEGSAVQFVEPTCKMHDLILRKTGLVDYGDLVQGAFFGNDNTGWTPNGKMDRLSTGIIPRISCNISAACDFENGYSLALLAFKGTKKIYDSGWQTSAISKSFADCDGFAVSLKRTVDGKEVKIYPNSVTGLTIEEDSYIKIQDPYKAVVLEQKVNKLSNGAKLPNPFIHKKYYSHLFIDKINADDNIVIPCQSVYDIDVASRLGFTVIEGNVQKTATDGKYVVMHGNGGYLGEQVVAVNDSVADPSTVTFSSLSYDDIRNNYVYRSKYAKYQTKIISLEEFLLECKKRSMIPFVQYVDDKMLEITKSIVGNDFILYNGSRDKYDGMIYIYGSASATKDEILAVCDSVGAPMMYGIADAVIDSFTDDEFTEIINEVHKRGCLIGWAGCYCSTTKNNRLLNLGMDFSATGWEVNDFESGNLLNANADMDFSDFVTTGTVANGVLTLASGDTVTVENLNQQFLAKGMLKIMFNGTIYITMGYKFGPTDENGWERKFTSDGTTTLQFSTYFMEEVPTFTITAKGATTITKIDYKVSKC